MARHLLIVPSLSCPAQCSYCFGPHQGSGRMDERVLMRTAEWLSALPGDGETLEVTFHGGEPLTAGVQFYQRALPLLMQSWRGKSVRFSIQSNLWLLNEAFLELFSGFPVSIGTSLDGPEEMNDRQRGAGYFRRTMQGIEKARLYGVPVGVIATFTASSARRWREVVEFFAREGLSFSVHAALPVLGVDLAKQPWVLPPSAYGELMVALLDYYLENLRRVRIATLDAMIRSVVRGKGGMCTFGNCLGEYLAVGADGGVYPCQRFAGMDAFRLGSIEGSRQLLEASPAWVKLANRESQVVEVCGECEFFDICHGGCPYNVLANGQEGIRDPYCEAYRSIFQKIVILGTEEFFKPEHIRAIVDASPQREQNLSTGGILDLMNGKPHPFEVAQNAGQVLGAVALAASRSAYEATEKLSRAGLVREPGRTLQALEQLKKRLTEPKTILNNLYLHVTFDCSLRCSHCYAYGGERGGAIFPAEEVGKQAMEAGRLGFRHLVITGGEPLVHPQIEQILTALKKVDGVVRPLRTVLRTSLVGPLNETMLKLLVESVDEVVISVDGDPVMHDQRRGKGSYERTVANLRRLVEVRERAEISLAAVLPLAQAQSGPGQHVRALARELGIRRVRIRPLLPLGRAVDHTPDLEAEVVWGHLTPDERIAYGFTPAASCGMGQNLYLEPDGTAYPCYAWHAPAWALGNVLEEGGLEQIVCGDRFRQLRRATVDTRERCKGCAYRYLCGGACRAWGRVQEEAQVDLNQAPGDCSHLKERARGMVISALKYLEIPTERWEQAGLPLD
ncbi:TIGR04083 family peptide-modifying radical SAM enzyme [Anaerolinea thermolimosa]|nr:TIGR04083 family peptide-modifying radical SAM enzyme [Anaerolinea thermolimosa]